MTAIGLAVKDESALPVGIQILAGANRDALAVAHAAGLDMIASKATYSRMSPMKAGSNRRRRSYFAIEK
jgi:predicted TIM-barrel enzyme